MKQGARFGKGDDETGKMAPQKTKEAMISKEEASTL